MYPLVRAIVAWSVCCALLASCGHGGTSAPVPISKRASTTASARASAPTLAAPEPSAVAPEDIGEILLGKEDLAKILGKDLEGDKESITPFPDQQVTPQACMTAVDIGFQRQLGEQVASFAYRYARTPKEEGPVQVVAEDVAIFPTQKGAGAALDALSHDLGRCSGSQAVQHLTKTQTWRVSSAPVQSKRIVWTTAQEASRDWHCDYQAQALSNVFFSVMFCQRGDAGGMAATVMRAIAGRVG